MKDTCLICHFSLLSRVVFFRFLFFFHAFVVVTSKTEGQTFRYRFGNETKTFCYPSQISLVENRLFQFCPEPALLGKIERITFDKTNSEELNGFIVSFLLDIGTFVERLWNVCSFTVLTLQKTSSTTSHTNMPAYCL